MRDGTEECFENEWERSERGVISQGTREPLKKKYKEMLVGRRRLERVNRAGGGGRKRRKVWTPRSVIG